jgi:hypothetical protein
MSKKDDDAFDALADQAAAAADETLKNDEVACSPEPPSI